MPATPIDRERALLERFTEPPARFGAYRLALGFPNSYEVGMSNLGFQWVFRLFNRVPDLVCERFFHEEGRPAATFETGTPLSDYGLLALSLRSASQWVFPLFTRVPALVCERFFHEEGRPAATFETGTPLSDFGLLAWSL